MRFTDAIRWGLYDRLLATLSLVAGLALAVGGLWIGASEWFFGALSGDAGATPGGVDAAIALGGVLLGLFVWQVGSAAARHRTMVTATRREVADREAVADADVAPSDEADRLAQLENDVEEVRRVAARIEQSMRTGQFEADGLGDDSAGAGTGGGAGATASGASAGAATGSSASSSTTDADETASEPAAPEIEFSDDPAGEDGADAGTASAGDTNEAVGDGGAVADADVDDGAVDDADGSATDDGASSDDATADDTTTDDGFEWPEEEEDEYYRNS